MPLSLFKKSRPPAKPAIPSSPATVTVREKLKAAFFAGVKKGWKNFLWMAKFLVPISLAMAILQWSGWLYKIDAVLNPVMHVIRLPSEAAFPILSALFLNIYATIAILTVVPFSPGQMVLIAVFSLIAHNIITEGVIQHNSGINAFKIVAIRVVVALVTVLVISPFLGDTRQSVGGMAVAGQQALFLHAMTTWGIDTGKTLLKIFGIIMGILVALECMSRLGWDNYLYWFFRPFMKVLGLSDRSVMLWVTAVIFGLMYGSAVILEKAKEGELTKSELERIHISIGINHSMVEDPALYMAIGVNGFWLYVPKLVMAIVCVQGYRLVEAVGSRWGKRSATAGG